MRPLAGERLRFSLLFGMLCGVGCVLLSGCGTGIATTTSTDVAATVPVTGILHGGPNPVVGARVVIYATTSSGYGMGTALAEANSVGATHQDTDINGSFSFAGGYTCPTGSYIYVVAYGGNSGSGNNPNSVLMAALGSCSALYQGAAGAYSGPTIYIDELTTIAAGYALGNFMNIAGDAVNGYTVGIGSDVGNYAATGCVANSYYGCTTTQAAGLAHAFALAGTLVSTTSGQANSVTANQAQIPVQLINTLGNVLQACVNSTGGGTDPGTGLPTTTTTAAGVSHDGTPCGRLSAYTSYTLNETPTGTLVAAGNTLGYVQNLAKRPTGNFVTFDSSCDSNSATGTTTAASCIYNVITPQVFYTVSMTAPPPDWMLAIYYPKGSLSSVANSAKTVCASSTTPATLGLNYPQFLATDINDDLVIFNTDASTGTCYNLISIGPDGSPLGVSVLDNTAQQSVWLANDAFGHSILPVHPSSGTTGGSVRVYSSGTDANILLANTLTATNVPAAGDAYYVTVDGSDHIYMDSQAGATAADEGYAFPVTPESHLTPTFTSATDTGYGGSGKGIQMSVDIKGNIFFSIAVVGGSAHPMASLAGSTNKETTGTASGNGSTSAGALIFPDTNNNVWFVYTAQGTNTQTAPAQTIVFNEAYTSTATSITLGTASTTYTATNVPSVDLSIKNGQIDGNNVLWWGDGSGASTCNGTTCPSQTTPYTAPTGPVLIYPGYVHGFDTVNTTFLPQSYGCEFTYATSTACGSQPTDQASTSTGYPSVQPYALWGNRALAIDASGNMWLANGVQGHITEVVGMAAPTWPMFIHNGVSNKP